jgi:hypothetical protein
VTATFEEVGLQEIWQSIEGGKGNNNNNKQS